MSQLTADTVRQYDTNEDPLFNDLPVKASVAIYRNSAVGLTSGYARQLTTSDAFMGFADAVADNSAVATNGAISVRVRQKGTVQLSVTSVAAVTDVGSTVYATDGNAFTLASTGNVAIGKIIRWVSGTTCLVRFEGAPVRSI